MAPSSKSTRKRSRTAPDTRVALVVPPDLASVLHADASARAVFDALAYTHRREHIDSITEAKKPETRTRRIEKTMAMLRSDCPTRSNTVSTRSTTEKMRISEGQRLLVLEADEEAMHIFSPLPLGCTIERKIGRGRYNVVVLFARDAATLGRRLPVALRAVDAKTSFWIAYPKQSSGRATTLTRDAGWEPADGEGIKATTMVAFDAVWAGVRYRLT
ncbi:MAG: YdeI/OmpD-associated family protein [Gemmatimonadales bacterium]